MPVERYGRAYYDRWYRREGFGSPARLDRKVRYALGAAEYLLDRPVRSVLDVGAGEGAWSAGLKRHRPRARYVGVDPSHYAVERFGRTRGLRLGRLGNLDDLGLPGPFDLIVCIDVLAYADDDEVQVGLRSIGSLLGGVALLEVFTSADSFTGDTRNYRRRRPSTYRRWFSEAGLEQVGPNLFVGEAVWPTLCVFERGH
jgi:SAM-dependent methyltransferase